MANKTTRARNREGNKPQKILVGKKVLYIGMLGQTTTCPQCNRSKRKGMVSLYNDQYYCSEDCVLKVANG